MGKMIAESNFRAVVEPSSLGDFGVMIMTDELVCANVRDRAERYKDKCSDIVDEIKRHADDVKCATIEWDTKEICTLCGYLWEVDETGEPLCCVEAQEEWKISKRKKVSEW